MAAEEGYTMASGLTVDCETPDLLTLINTLDIQLGQLSGAINLLPTSGEANHAAALFDDADATFVQLRELSQAEYAALREDAICWRQRFELDGVEP